MKMFLFAFIVFLIGVPVFASAEAVPCSPEKIAAILTPATESAQEILVDCKLTLTSSDSITKRIVIQGAEANGTVISCNGATIAPAYGTNAIVVASRQTENSTQVPPIGKWSAPYDVRVTGCNVTGRIWVVGVPNDNAPGDFYNSSRLDGHTKRVQDAAPSKIVFASLTITANGRSALYVAPGSTKVTLRNSRLRGYSDKAPAVYLDAETAYNVIQNNRFETDNPIRETMAIDGSAYNTIIGNYFAKLDRGGIFLYRNCGEGGVIRHQTPNHNQIINNIFYYDIFDGSKPSIHIDSRMGNRSYCELDAGYPFGSSVSDLDYVTDTVVIKNRIYIFEPSTMIWTHGSPADIRLNEIVPAGTNQPKRASQCYDINSETVYEHNATRDVSGFAYTCKDGIWVSPVLGRLNPLRDFKGQYQLGGWACLKASPSSIDVHLYVDGPYDVGAFFRTVSANRTTTPAIDTQCGTTGVPHTFSYRLTSAEFDSNKGQTIFVYGVSGFPDIANEVLNGSGQKIPTTPPQ
ncbi:MAG: right-handed parallel beta-helix repeat-containing protein [Nitrospira sp.]|nr:right-handed parallel beta-helix repeat-containing protein [Nitrospira sp.]